MAQPQVIVYSGTDVENIPMLSNDQTFTGDNTFTEPIVVTKAIGTAPFTTTSTTVNTNLNADMVDGKHRTTLYSDMVFNNDEIISLNNEVIYL